MCICIYYGSSGGQAVRESMKRRIIRQWLTAFRVCLLLSQLIVIDEEHNSHVIQYSTSIVPCSGATMIQARVGPFIEVSV